MWGPDHGVMEWSAIAFAPLRRQTKATHISPIDAKAVWGPDHFRQVIMHISGPLSPSNLVFDANNLRDTDLK